MRRARKATRSGRSRWRVNWTTRSSTSDSMNRRSASLSFGRPATPRRCWRTTPSSMHTMVDWFIRECATVSPPGVRAGSISRHGSLIALDRAGRIVSPVCLQNWRSPPIAQRCSTGTLSLRKQHRSDDRRRARLNFGPYAMCSSAPMPLRRDSLASQPTEVRAKAAIDEALDASASADLGLITFDYDKTDWADEIRIMLEERASFSPDALTGMEANLTVRRTRDDANQNLPDASPYGRTGFFSSRTPRATKSRSSGMALGLQPIYDRRRV